MRKLDLTNVEAVEPGSREKLPGDGYIVRFDGYEDEEDKERVWLVFDVNEGPRAGFYSDPYYKDKPWRHRVMLSYKDTALGALKGRLQKVTECNPGFDAVAAFQAGQLDMFVGRKAALVAGTEQDAFRNDKGEWVATEDIDWFHAKWTTPDKVRSGDFQVPETTQTDDYKRHIMGGAGGALAAQAAPSDPYGDIPL